MRTPERFAVVTFTNVYDTVPVQEFATLDELQRALTRFELKRDLARRMRRERERARLAWEAFQEGTHRAGRWSSAIRKAARGADDPAAAAEAKYQELLAGAGKKAKTELRLWAPAWYAGAGKRGNDNVVHVSCLVLDYDNGATLDEAHEAWSQWRHIIHTTLSHSDQKARFRVIVPLAQPVLARDWARVWTWADARTGGAVDPACKSAGGTFALPALTGPEAPHRTVIHEAPLLDPLALGLIDQAAPTVASPISAGSAIFRAGDPEASYLEAGPPPIDEMSDPEDPDEDDWEEFGSAFLSPGAGRSAQGGEARPTTVPPPIPPLAIPPLPTADHAVPGQPGTGHTARDPAHAGYPAPAAGASAAIAVGAASADPGLLELLRPLSRWAELQLLDARRAEELISEEEWRARRRALLQA